MSLKIHVQPCDKYRLCDRAICRSFLFRRLAVAKIHSHRIHFSAVPHALRSNQFRNIVSIFVPLNMESGHSESLFSSLFMFKNTYCLFTVTWATEFAISTQPRSHDLSVFDPSVSISPWLKNEPYLKQNTITILGIFSRSLKPL